LLSLVTAEVSQVEYCTDLICEHPAALDQMHERLLDLNRSIGGPDKIAKIFGRRITRGQEEGSGTVGAAFHRFLNLHPPRP
jgi:hypothetical protein